MTVLPVAPIGVWISYYSDGSTMVPHSSEIEELRAVVAQDGRDGITVDVDYSGPVEDTAVAARRYCTQPDDFVVAIVEVTP